MKLTPPLSVFALQFPHGLEVDAVTQFLRAIAASPSNTLVGLEVIATRGRIQHFVVTSAQHAIKLQRHLHDDVPGLRLEPAEFPAPAQGIQELVRIRQRGTDYQLDVEQVVAASRQFLSACAGLRGSEQAWLRVRLAPAGRARPGPTPPTRAQVTRGLLPASDPLPRTKAREAKRGDFGLWVEAQLQVVARNRSRARSLANSLTQHLRLLTSSLAGLSVERSGWLGVRAFDRRSLHRLTALLLNVQEAPGLLGWPLEAETVSGLQLGLSRVLPRPVGLGTSGAILGRDADGKTVRVVAGDRLRHLHVIGPSGVGKSTLMAGLALQDMADGRAVVVIDPKADLVSDLLSRLPEDRVDDVIVIDPSASSLVGFNPLGGRVRPETRAEHVLHVFRSLFTDSWGPRTDDILRACLLTLTNQREAHSLAELPLLLSHPGFRRRLVSSVDDPFGVSAFWAGFEALSPENQLQHIGPVMNKLRALLMRPSIRTMVGQTTGLDFDAVMRDRRIVLVPLSSGLLGTQAARLLGSLLMLSLWNAVQARTRLNRRPAVFVYLDEFQDLLHLPVPLDEALVQARGLGVGLTLAHQHLAQLTPNVRAAVLSSARNRVIFNLARADSKVLADELGPLVTTEDLMGLPAFEAIARVVHRHETLSPLTLRTERLGDPLRDPRELARRSAETWGRPRAEVERDLRRLLDRPDDAAPVGRRRLS